MKTVLCSLFLSAPLFAQTPVLSYHNDNYRSGLYSSETTLTPSNVTPGSFGKLFVLPADGKVDAEPLYVPKLNIAGAVHNVVFVASENDTVYAYDADTTQNPLWRVSMLKSGEQPSDSRGCDQIYPTIGVTATPAIDLKSGPHGTIYIAAMSKDSSGNYHQRLHALDITTGAEQYNGPIDVAATYPGSGDGSANGVVSFNPAQYKERPGLAVFYGTVYTTWSSHCDFRPYTGWIISYDEYNLKQRSVLNFTPNGEEGSVWQSGAGPAIDNSGNLYFLAANGTFDTTLNSAGFPISGDYGNAFMKVSIANYKLAVADYFATYNTVSESQGDIDLGSGGAMLLPQLPDANGVMRHFVVGAGKNQDVLILDTQKLGKFNPSNNNGAYQVLSKALNGGVWGAPAYFNGRLFYGGSNDFIRSFNYSHGQFAFSGKTAHQFGFPGATPSVSSNGNSNAILWAAENTSTAVLHAYDATNLATEFYNSNDSGTRDQFGVGNKYIAPMIANGKVYVATTTGVGVFGLLAPGKN